MACLFRALHQHERECQLDYPMPTNGHYQKVLARCEMTDRHVEYWLGWTITVSLLNVDTWRYIATREDDMYSGTVRAYNRTDAAGIVKSIILVAEG
jgi:hypothetical protein